MKAALFAIILASLLPVVATGQTVSIRSGDHPSFTRLVFSVPAETGWSAGRSAGGYDIEFDLAAPVFETQSVFDRISSRRLTGLQNEGARLTLQIDCDCHIRAIPWRNDRVVIDITDGPAPNGKFEAPLDPVPVQPSPAILPLVLAIPPSKPAAVATLPNPFEVALDHADSLEEFEIVVGGGLSRAATQGLVGGQTQPSTTSQTPDETTPAVQGAIADALDELAAVWPGMSAQTSVDRDRPSPTSAPGIGSTDNTCLPPEYFQVADWGDGTSFGDQIGMARAMLYGEFDRSTSTAALELAKTYLYFGFGQEARQVLSFLDTPSVAEQIALAMAGVVDGDETSDPILLSQSDCGPPAALWGLLAMSDLTSLGPIESGPLVREFRQLPGHLKGHLGNRLADKLVLLGHPEAAETVLGRSLQSATGLTIDAEIALAGVTNDEHSGERALALLRQQGSDKARLTPKETLRLLEIVRSRGLVADPEVLDFLSALRFEFRNTPSSAELLEAEVTHRLIAGDFNTVFTMFHAAEIATSLSGDQRRELGSRAVGALTQNADDATFIAMALGHIPDGIIPGTINAAAKRLIHLNFPERALALIGDGADGEDQTERRYLRAEAYAMLGHSEAVANEMLGFDTARADAIRQAVEIKIDTNQPQERLTIMPTTPHTPSLKASRDALMATTQMRAKINQELSATPVTLGY